MRLLIVAMPESIHTARWILQLLDQGWTIFLFPSTFYVEEHDLLKPHVDRSYAWRRFFGGKIREGKIYVCGPLDFGLQIPRTRRRLGKLMMHFLVQMFPYIQHRHFQWVVKKFRPDLVHSLEFQSAGYLCLEAKEQLGWFPKWMATNWGSDIMLYGRLPWSQEVVKGILANCDIYSCECHRDVALAREMGFKGKIWPVLPNTGGFDLEMIKRLRAKHEKSPRNLIMLKGYSGWSGRAVFAVQALKKCADLLKNYKVMLVSWNDDTRIALELASQKHGFTYELVPHHYPHEKILELHAEARVYIGASISDGVSTTCLEAMAMGAFPIQSKSACCGEWFRNGESGIVFDGENIDELAAALRRVLSDHELCESARHINDEIVASRLGFETIRQQVIQNYRNDLSLSLQGTHKGTGAGLGFEPVPDKISPRDKTLDESGVDNCEH